MMCRAKENSNGGPHAHILSTVFLTKQSPFLSLFIFCTLQSIIEILRKTKICNFRYRFSISSAEHVLAYLSISAVTFLSAWDCVPVKQTDEIKVRAKQERQNENEDEGKKTINMEEEEVKRERSRGKKINETRQNVDLREKFENFSGTSVPFSHE